MILSRLQYFSRSGALQLTTNQKGSDTVEQNSAMSHWFREKNQNQNTYGENWLAHYKGAEHSAQLYTNVENCTFGETWTPGCQTNNRTWLEDKNRGHQTAIYSERIQMENKSDMELIDRRHERGDIIAEIKKKYESIDTGGQRQTKNLDGCWTPDTYCHLIIWTW